MSDRILKFIESLVADYGPVKVAAWPLSVVGVLVTLGVLSGGSSTRVAIQILVAIAILVIGITLTIRNHRLRIWAKDASQSAVKYAERVIENEGLDYSIVEWKERQRFSKKRYHCQRDIKIRVGDTRPLLLCWIKCQKPSWGDVLKEADQDRVRISVREIADDGKVGARLSAVTAWEGNTPQTFIDFRRPLDPGAEFTLRFELDWPGYKSDILRGRPGQSDWKYHRAVESFSLEAILEKDLGFSNVNVSTSGGLQRPEIKSSGGVIQIEFPDFRPGVGPSEFSMVVDPVKK